MTDKQKIVDILKAYTKKHNISASVVILEEYAEELVKQGFTNPVRCKSCKHWQYQGEDNIFECGFGKCTHPQWEMEEFPHQTNDDEYCGCGELKEMKQ